MDKTDGEHESLGMFVEPLTTDPSQWDLWIPGQLHNDGGWLGCVVKRADQYIGYTAASEARGPFSTFQAAQAAIRTDPAPGSLLNL